ncbi:MAG: hypothetical protein UX85_C0001G0170 [Candidatus Beckwithbacteria bacterium GW2011_GWB1_47_15]|uniref:Uncharacterized protein n=1 Tax=Candidatus Beckwithbacteria bacterium GW2011_GWB1_47_15 TaxID=1618371 RepID=A0A0G1RXW4_9BACT|nr:MAG: hypothetical protein UY43_C0001G0956 [Candidatus Beckwithbacteria bacterium GW2011_GWC1_49_16]AQS30807.1 hypothetical protein [uncultured bacterium]KKU35992.1 MAG: hypothetical protein UX50_C0001G0169 [Candidatus Beckwithbacteria bacterium GW2011_GWA1_46_30]KKU61956.1 MAG: hypothetical protein UX85_C0001G0170 [Candidatus Beckwithbacteria bacterium GW2011_GWB1_47_15]KKU72490.1 MAG: hypothetical protein UX97_C0001G0360 [Candidatus Beckwithbacteria bacterium GW2011_GWA2_47_25]KKW04343.1 M
MSPTIEALEGINPVPTERQDLTFDCFRITINDQPLNIRDFDQLADEFFIGGAGVRLKFIVAEDTMYVFSGAVYHSDFADALRSINPQTQIQCAGKIHLGVTPEHRVSRQLDLEATTLNPDDVRGSKDFYTEKLETEFSKHFALVPEIQGYR